MAQSHRGVSDNGKEDMKETDTLNRRQQKLLAAGAMGIFILLSALVIWLIGVPMLRFASRPEAFRDWIEGHGAWGRLAYMGMVITQVLVAFIPGEPLEIAGGYAFSALEGTALCLLASALGSAIVILLVRRYGVRLVEVFFTREKIRSLRFLRSSPKRTLLFLIIFMVPGTPKDLLCYFAGLTDIRLPVLLLICSLGRIPSIVTSTLGGDALGTRQYLFAAVVFAITLAVSVLGLMGYDRLCKKGRARPRGTSRTMGKAKETEMRCAR